MQDDPHFKERASVVFGRPSVRKKKQAPEGPRAGPLGGLFSCLDGCFGKLMGFPTTNPESLGAVYGEPKALEPVVPCVRWADLAGDRRVGVKHVEVASGVKECQPGWVNQDATCACGVPEACKSESLFFCVFDGHGKWGHEVAGIAAERLPSHLAAFSNGPLSNPKGAMEVAFKQTDDDIYSAMGSRVEYSGSTGVAVMLDPGKRILHVGNVGDSRCVLGKCSNGMYTALALTADLKPDLPAERERIELSGGTVMSLEGTDGTDVGPARVWDSAAREKPGLAVSRSLGDGASRCLGVIADPVVTTHKLGPEDRFILIATDGLWDSVPNEEAVQMAGKYLDKGLPQVAVKALTEAVRREEGGQLVDDTTMVLVVFG